VLGQSDNYRIHGTGVSITAKHELRYARDFRTIYTYQSLGEPYLQWQDGSQRLSESKDCGCNNKRCYNS